MEDLIPQDIAERISGGWIKKRERQDGSRYRYLRIPESMIMEDIYDAMRSNQSDYALQKYGISGETLFRIPGYKNVFCKIVILVEKKYIDSVMGKTSLKGKDCMLAITCGCLFPRTLSKYFLVEQVLLEDDNFFETDIDDKVAQFMTTLLCKQLDPLLELSVRARIKQEQE